MKYPGQRVIRLGIPLFLWSLLGGPLAANLDVVQFKTGFSRPIFLTHAPDGIGRLFVVEQRGRIRIIDAGGTVLAQDFLDLGPTGLNKVSQSASGNETGLLGLAFHPRYVCNGRFFVHYTRLSDGASIVAEYAVSADPNVANTAETVTFGPLAQPQGNHNGGMIAFGPDGYLYIALGDGGGGGDAPNHGPIGNGQDTTNLLGNILRIDIDNPEAPNNYGIPFDNPYVGTAGFREEIYAYGFRNPWRFSFDRLDGRLFCGDVGQLTIEEIDLVLKGGNYGWRIMEGSICYPPPTVGCQTGSLLLPIGEYTHGEGCSVTGGYVYRGGVYPALYGLYLFADYCTGIIWSLTQDTPLTWTRTQLFDAPFRISSFGEDQSGELYVCDLLNGIIYQVVDTTPRPANPTISVVPASLDFADQDVSDLPCPSRFITIANVGTANLTFTGLKLDVIGPAAAFTISNNPDTNSPLASGENLLVQLDFDPSMIGATSAALRITTNDPASPTADIPLTGDAVPIGLAAFELE